MKHSVENWERIEAPEASALAAIDWGRIGLGVATGGASEGVRALTGKSSIYDPVLDAVGLGIPKVGPEPNAGDYYGGVEASNAENLRRAYEMADQKQIREPDAIMAERISGHQTSGPMATDAHNAGGVERAQVERVAAPGQVVSPWLPDAAKVAAAKAGPAAHAEGGYIGPAALQSGTHVGQTDTNSTASDLLTQAALGTAPSKAEALLNAGLDKTAKKQLSMAAGAKGSERRGARRAAMLAIGDQGADAAQQLAALRADEMERGRGALSQMEQHKETLKQGVLSLQAQIDSAAARGDADAVNRLKAQQAEMTARASEVNAGADNTRSEADTQRQQRADEINAAAADANAQAKAGYNFKAQEGNVDREMRAADANAGRTTAASMADAAAANARAESLARRRDETDQQYATRVQAWQEANAARDMDTQKTNAANAQTVAAANVAARQAADVGNATVKSNALGGARQATGQETDIENMKFSAATAKYQAEKAAAAAAKNARLQTGLKIGTAIATGGGSLAVPGGMPTLGTPPPGPDDPLPLGYTSDRRAKTDIKKVGDKEAIRLSDAYQKMISTYKYKKGDGRTTAGVMAQDLAKDPLGKKFVSKGGDGLLAIDYHGLNSAVLAGLAAKLDAQTQRTAKARRS